MIQANSTDVYNALKEVATVNEDDRDYLQAKVIVNIFIRCRLAYCGLMITTLREY